MIRFNQSMFCRPSFVRARDARLGLFPFVAWLVEETQPKLCVELGMPTGDQYFGLCQVVKTAGLRSTCYGVGMWPENPGGEYQEASHQFLSKYNAERYSSFSHLIRSSVEDALRQFDDGAIDILYIDGAAHAYEEIMRIYASWRPKMSSRGVMVFDSITRRDKGCGAWKFWDEISASLPALEFRGFNGLGALLVGSSCARSLSDLASLEKDAWSNVERLFVGLGEGVFPFAEITRLEGIVELNDKVNRRSFETVKRALENEKQSAIEKCQLLEGSLDHKNALIASMDGRIKALENTLFEGRSEAVAELRAQLAKRQEKIEEIYRSTSWRITAPLRAIVIFLRRKRTNMQRKGAAAQHLRPQSGLCPSPRRRTELDTLDGQTACFSGFHDRASSLLPG